MMTKIKELIFNWLTDGKVKINREKKDTTMSTVIGGNGTNTITLGPSIGGSGTGLGYGYSGPAGQVQSISLNQALTFTIQQAGGGWVVQTGKFNHTSYQTDTQLHIIPEGADFDRELGKIITMSCLRS